MKEPKANCNWTKLLAVLKFVNRKRSKWYFQRDHYGSEKDTRGHGGCFTEIHMVVLYVLNTLISLSLEEPVSLACVPWVCPLSNTQKNDEAKVIPRHFCRLGSIQIPKFMTESMNRRDSLKWLSSGQPDWFRLPGMKNCSSPQRAAIQWCVP